MASNYPPGVSGFEPEIAGPADERDEYREVQCEDEDNCDFAGEVNGLAIYWSYDTVDFEWTCPVCSIKQTTHFY